MKKPEYLACAVLAAAAVSAPLGACSSGHGDRGAQTYAHPEVTFEETLNRAAAQCPDAISPRQIVAAIARASNWQASRDPDALGRVGLAGYTPEFWDTLSDGDPNDPRAAIAAIAADTCGRANDLDLREKTAAGDIYVDFGDIDNLPAAPVDAELSAATWAAYQGGDYVLTRGASVNDSRIGEFLHLMLDEGDKTNLD